MKTNANDFVNSQGERVATADGTDSVKIGGGLTKREFMATQIAAGLAANNNVDFQGKAAWAVMFADELIKSLNQGSSNEPS